MHMFHSYFFYTPLVIFISHIFIYNILLTLFLSFSISFISPFSWLAYLIYFSHSYFRLNVYLTLLLHYLPFYLFIASLSFHLPTTHIRNSSPLSAHHPFPPLPPSLFKNIDTITKSSTQSTQKRISSLVSDTQITALIPLTRGVNRIQEAFMFILQSYSEATTISREYISKSWRVNTTLHGARLTIFPGINGMYGNGLDIRIQLCE